MSRSHCRRRGEVAGLAGVCPRPLSRGFLTATSSHGSRERGLGGQLPSMLPSGRPLRLGGWGHIRRHPWGRRGCAGGGCGAGGGLGFSSGLGSSVGRLTLRRRENAGVFSSLS